MAIDYATTNRPINEFYKLNSNVRILANNKNLYRKTWQLTRRIQDKAIMNRAQQEHKNYLNGKYQNSLSDFLESFSPENLKTLSDKNTKRVISLLFLRSFIPIPIPMRTMKGQIPLMKVLSCSCKEILFLAMELRRKSILALCDI